MNKLLWISAMWLKTQKFYKESMINVFKTVCLWLTIIEVQFLVTLEKLESKILFVRDFLSSLRNVFSLLISVIMS